MSDDHAVHVFDLENQDKKGKPVKLHTQKADRNKIFGICWKPTGLEFQTVGVKHCYNWTMTAQALKGRKGAISSIPTAKGKSIGFTAVAWSPKSNAYLASGSDGVIYTWKGASLSGKGEPAHKKMASCVNVIQSGGKELVLTGSSDKTVRIYENAGTKLTPIAQLKVDATPRSVDLKDDQLLVGTSAGTIVEFRGITSNPSAPEEVVQMRSHAEGETWGLTMIREDKIYMYLTSGDDNKLLLHDINLKKVVGDGVIQTVTDIKALPKKKKVGGASTQSNLHPHQQSRALAYNYHLNHLAVGHNDGDVSIRQVEGIEEAANGEASVKLDNI